MINFKKLLDILLDLIYPHKCMFCDEVINLNEEKWICKYCIPELDYITEDFEPTLAVLEYNDKIKNAVYRFKYNNCREYSKGFAILLYNKFLKKSALNYDLVVYAPMFHKKKKKRTYDQAELLAIEFSKLSKIPVEINNLIRTKDTLPQSKVDFKSREDNVKNAFTVTDKDVFKNKNVLLIDDIYTSGNTMAQCCKELKNAGAKNICSLTVFKVNFDS